FWVMNPHAARKFHRAPPDVFGLGVMTETSLRTRSLQSLTALGFPFRTRKTIDDVYGEELPGNRSCQPGLIYPRSSSASISEARARVARSALSPPRTARAWAPEPPWELLTVIGCPVLLW